jgi:hypothetical protein
VRGTAYRFRMKSFLPALAALLSFPAFAADLLIDCRSDWGAGGVTQLVATQAGPHGIAGVKVWRYNRGRVAKRFAQKAQPDGTPIKDTAQLIPASPEYPVKGKPFPGEAIVFNIDDDITDNEELRVAFHRRFGLGSEPSLIGTPFPGSLIESGTDSPVVFTALNCAFRY